MNHAPSLTKLKTFSNSSLLLDDGLLDGWRSSNPHRQILRLLMLLCFSLLAACSGMDREASELPAGPPPKRLVGKVPTPPWEFWGKDALGNEAIARAEQALTYGELSVAVDQYRQAYETADTPRVKEEAFVRMCSTLLKQGRSQAALEAIAADAKTRGVVGTSIGERLSLIAAYGYLHQRDIDQSLAWLSTTMSTSAGKTAYGNRAKEEAQQVLAAFSAADFERYSQRWAGDGNIGPLFVRERLRRAQGGQSILRTDATNYYAAQTYGDTSVPTDAPVATTVAAQLPPANYRRIGILLPLTGEFGEHGSKAKQGIDLAVQQLGGGLEVVVADTRGDPVVAEQEYERLARVERVSIVLGPLLVKTAERVAAKSQEIAVPFIAFTKRSGLPALGESVFRLGATVENQVDELLAYGVAELALRRFAIIYPQLTSGHEFAAYFKDAVQRRGGTLVVETSYVPGDAASIASAVQQASSIHADAVFVPDTLEGAQSVFQQLKSSALSKAVLLGPAQWNDPVAVRGYGQLLEGAVYVTPFNAKSLRPEVLQFVQQYREKYQRDPELLAAQGYDAAKVAISTLAQPIQSAEDITQRLYGVASYAGVTGELSIDRDGEISRRMSVVRMSAGDAVEVMASGAVSGFYPTSSGGRATSSDGQGQSSSVDERKIEQQTPQVTNR